MPEFDRLSGCIEWIDLSFVKRQRTPKWTIQVGIQCHLAGMSLQYTSKHLESLGVGRSHVAIHDWVHKADLQPASTVTEDQIAVDETMIRINGDDHWLYGAVGPETNEIIHPGLSATTTKQTPRWFLDELHQQCYLDETVFLVDGANYLGPVLNEDGDRFQVISSGNRNAIEHISYNIESRKSSFANSFSHVDAETAQSWLNAFAVYHNSRQN